MADQFVLDSGITDSYVVVFYTLLQLDEPGIVSTGQSGILFLSSFESYIIWEADSQQILVPWTTHQQPCFGYWVYLVCY